MLAKHAPAITADHARSLAAIRTLRDAISERIEADIALLDALGPDPDFEEEGDAEPTFGWPTGGSQLRLGRSAEVGEGEPDADGEPSLGWDGRETSQAYLQTLLHDGEPEDGHDAESGADEEPTLGALDRQPNQLLGWGQGDFTCGDEGEPSLGWPESAGAGLRAGDFSAASTRDGENEAEPDAEDGGDREPDHDAEHDSVPPKWAEFVKPVD